MSRPKSNPQAQEPGIPEHLVRLDESIARLEGLLTHAIADAQQQREILGQRITAIEERLATDSATLDRLNILDARISAAGESFETRLDAHEHRLTLVAEAAGQNAAALDQRIDASDEALNTRLSDQDAQLAFIAETSDKRAFENDQRLDAVVEQFDANLRLAEDFSQLESRQDQLSTSVAKQFAAIDERLADLVDSTPQKPAEIVVAPIDPRLIDRIEESDLRRADLTSLVDQLAKQSAAILSDHSAQLTKLTTLVVSQTEAAGQATELARTASTRVATQARRIENLGESVELWLNDVTSLLTDLTRRVDLQERRAGSGSWNLDPGSVETKLPSANGGASSSRQITPETADSNLRMGPQ